ncbi:MAG: 16S rRNA (guanine(527)-N(7))-methyltransferase RsmG [Gammaproteobacteria bacterium]|uniref:16S rRNA (guanine(527)-N(7))-methyltransferase RsmG n=1 Tax=Rhodoferax sp. TaxID=50421 RepID=UPI001809D21D|nr:16S rRNA (guanine(527)-N(7))-methyltransferase RsmG [Rhodoferax sp.]MBU3900815.1 16S rRNA (guanine(527)-N(7))-methyltransferase RsmG [Gammaproteobacteria bacterium]MBA3060032.1 16S rRNA (guanine(527)-N(7))-methyltransferase RsmG [Rhodoferax sp.]MBU3996577.1 16S rRNA (guanine(527)-N(7))-methyltransferase RsmG [Gammaproteobacteria bacterium]MBU4079566.1 16S rRNA (guanine(527)-N(7))-methyltransferase RsmG [Gammaproteobacteria bacterium]MBU4112256.1 16S rRNA (guanine(527)-N(7))-methyltransferas
MRELESALRNGLADLSLALDDRQIGLLLDYLALIGKWTQVYNLTSVRDPVEMLTHHLLDSLAVVPALRRQLAELPVPAPGEDAAKLRLLDVGSGAGLPGVVIAICCPEIMVDCVDTVAKKVAFIRQAAATLRLANLHGLHARVESLTEPYQVIGARAFASLVDFTRLSMAALAPQGIWLAMKAKNPADEIAGLPAQVQVFHVERLLVPGLHAERCIVWMRAVAA